jgi:hypothetical protein
MIFKTLIAAVLGFAAVSAAAKTSADETYFGAGFISGHYRGCITSTVSGTMSMVSRFGGTLPSAEQVVRACERLLKSNFAQLNLPAADMQFINEHAQFHHEEALRIARRLLEPSNSANRF